LADRRFTAAFIFPITRAELFRTAEATEALAEFCVGRFVVFGDFVSDFLDMRAPRFMTGRYITIASKLRIDVDQLFLRRGIDRALADAGLYGVLLGIGHNSIFHPSRPRLFRRSASLLGLIAINFEPKRTR